MACWSSAGNFKTAIAHNEFALVLCILILTSKYAKVAQNLLEQKSTIKLAKVGATEEQSLPEERNS